MTEEPVIIKKVKKLEDRILRKVLHGNGDRCNPIDKGVMDNEDCVCYFVDSEVFVVFFNEYGLEICTCGWYKKPEEGRRTHAEELLSCEAGKPTELIVDTDRKHLADCLYDTCLIRKHAELYRLAHAKKEQKSKEKQE